MERCGLQTLRTLRTFVRQFMAIPVDYDVILCEGVIGVSWDMITSSLAMHWCCYAVVI